MTHAFKTALSLGFALVLTGAVVSAGAEEHGFGRPAAPRGEAFSGPRGYSHLAEPHGWNNRPSTVDRGVYQHNFVSPRHFRIGVYHRPPGWVEHHWGYGEILPPAYWAPEYILADYWLFGLEVAPIGYEWVRDEDDAILVNTATGEILQVQYGVFI